MCGLIAFIVSIIKHSSEMPIYEFATIKIIKALFAYLLWRNKIKKTG